jgi:hypothetical protein
MSIKVHTFRNLFSRCQRKKENAAKTKKMKFFMTFSRLFVVMENADEKLIGTLERIRKPETSKDRKWRSNALGAKSGLRQQACDSLISFGMFLFVLIVCLFSVRVAPSLVSIGD